ncbi:MAG TPA: PhnD/SsuA/transferrin family substrate-binding protein [Acidisoma sp.]|uniref:phosphate/phosphite/phosphonate ABC transporter substrate-binding protein n=1 Tax=Acidisoma sp. TaxID=1872115 RepID=UPI002BD30299|nr:PhnD/SsuA/transferrin family substrate-binding protein [Acidisoma sp.]HTI03630.1 PhnD/SsuA/transferrin family substrate-binding protein [Acidisoma sp.]
MSVSASLPMYALPEMAAANAALWDALREGLGEEQRAAVLPETLRPAGLALPAAIDRGTLFTQMCGYPLKTLYAGQYQMLGTPLYDLPGCRLRPDGVPTHCSFLVVRAEAPFWTLEQLRGARFAINGRDSNSGMNLPRRLFAPWAQEGRFFADVLVSGSHAASMEMVGSGAADAAAIDCVTFGFATRFRPALTERLRVLAETPASPGIPFVTSVATSPATARRLTALLTGPFPPLALQAALEGLAIHRVAPPHPAAYDAVLAYEAEAAAMGYPELV